ncbi:MAG: hypothetical protein J0L84_15525 [Verrucomicrobia bacterium]|nr:hypothetical protein [Verrucomicrobiota bacterium]
MIPVIALTQLAFISLAVVFAKILFRADGADAASGFALWVQQHGMWLFLVPVAWVILARVCETVRRAPLSPPVARAMGVTLSVAAFVFLLVVTVNRQ